MHMKRLIIPFIMIFTLLNAQVPEKIRSKSIPLGVGFSTVLPGAGQWYAGSKAMAVLYVTLEAVFIGGNIYFVHQGDQAIDDYKDFADEYWLVETWLEKYNPVTDPTTHTATVYVDNRAYSPQIESSYNAMIADMDNGYDNISIDKDYHFYENIGKYEQFKAGWVDWTLAGEDPGDPMQGIYRKYSNDQYEYAGMRRAANDLLRIGGYFGTALFFNHFISAIDAGFRIKKLHANQEILCKLYYAPMISASNMIGIQTGIHVTF